MLPVFLVGLRWDGDWYICITTIYSIDIIQNVQIERAVLSKITILNAIIIHFNILMKPMVRSPLLRNVVTAIDKVRLYANTCVMPIGCDPCHSCILTHCQIHTHSHSHSHTSMSVCPYAFYVTYTKKNSETNRTD